MNYILIKPFVIKKEKRNSEETGILFEASSTRFIEEVLFELTGDQLEGDHRWTREKGVPAKGRAQTNAQRHEGRSPAMNYDRMSCDFELLGE